MLVTVRLDSFPPNQCFNWCFTIAYFVLMDLSIVVVRQLLVQIFLWLLVRLLQLLAEGYLIKLIQDRPIKLLAETVDWRRHTTSFFIDAKHTQA